MDESWRRRLGMSSRTPHRTAKSKTTTSSCSDFTRRRSSLSDTLLDPDDFADVYGGPPQTVLLRRFSGEFVVSPPSFYNEVFRRQEAGSPAVNVGRSLKGFRIPEPTTTESFFGDIFGSKAKSMSNSSSVLSSEDLSPMRTAIDDPALSSFASKLRPINVPTRWSSALVVPEEAARKQQEMSEFACPRSSPVVDDNDGFVEAGGYLKQQQPFRSHFSRQVTSPEAAVSIEPSSVKIIYGDDDDVDETTINSPSSAVSSLCQETRHNYNFMIEEDEDNDDDDEMSGSYVIEIDSNHHREEVISREAIGVDDAIAWAKERFNAHRDFKNSTTTLQQEQDHAAQNQGQERPSLCEYDLPQNTVVGHHPSSQMEMKADNMIRSWSDGKEQNIRLLLSTLDQVLWGKSGWNVVPLTSLKDSTQVKKAYQKARLCLHPDKLQQRGATLEQKHIAHKVFSILQDAWDSFTTNDVFIR